MTSTTFPTTHSSSGLFDGNLDEETTAYEERRSREFLFALNDSRKQEEFLHLNSEDFFQVWNSDASECAETQPKLSPRKRGPNISNQTKTVFISKTSGNSPIRSSSTGTDVALESTRLTRLLQETHHHLDCLSLRNADGSRNTSAIPRLRRPVKPPVGADSAPLGSGINSSDVDSTTDTKTNSTTPEAEASQEQKFLQLLKFAGVQTEAATAAISSPQSAIFSTRTPWSRPNYSRSCDKRPFSPTSKPDVPVNPSTVKFPTPANPYSRTPVTSRSRTPVTSCSTSPTPVTSHSRSPVSPCRTFKPSPPVSTSRKSMQIHRPLQFTLSTRMLDIDLPRISITTSTDNYTTNRTGKTQVLQPAVSAASSCASSHLLSASFLTQPRSRSPSLRSRSPSPSPRPVVALPPSVKQSPVPMAVLSRTPIVRKSPSLTSAAQMRAGAAVPRSSSADRPIADGLNIPRRSPSPRPQSGSSSSLNKLALPSPVVIRRHSTKSPMVSARSVISSPVTPKIGLVRSGQPAVAPRRKSPVIASRNRAYTVSTVPSTVRPGVSVGNTATQNPEDQQKVKYERNLKKFYTWCQHCRRVQRISPSDSVAKGPLQSRSGPQQSLSGPPQSGSAATKPTFVRTMRLSAPNIKPISRVPSRAVKTPASKHSLFSFDSSELPLGKTHNVPYNGSFLHSQSKMPKDLKERPKSARNASSTEPIPIEKPKFQSLFDFDDALSLTPDQVDLMWMMDPLEDDDDFFSYNHDVETMSICSDSSIVAMAITCDTKLKDDDDEFPKMSLRKTYSSHQ